ncbi:universal stress protein UspA [Arthrobacter sp. ERGS1:01]|uniref:universal stress protein n=1 Tax=Arthrobacter sp. ERGS1:01 TaxID=1704044 RepID=UPI0006B542BB|nr:universal stress protein [Arthrobacter sp. ERGS1:01]ALE05632.1 universal stress protein UspA [Arthrobacter sp. ERGS1:01]
MKDQPEKPVMIVGIDGSDASIEALRQAVRLAAALGARVEAVLCWNYPSVYEPPTMMGTSTAEFEGEAQKVLDGAVERAVGLDWPDSLTTRLIHGPARPALIEASKNAVMLVLGRRGFGGFLGLLMGSVSSACTAHASCPVLVVHYPLQDKSHV